MLKYVVYALIIIAILGLAASGIHLYRVASKNKREMARYQGSPISISRDFGKVLVVYYSLSGNTKNIAERIKEKTGADLYEIKTMEPIEATPTFYIKSKQQLANEDYPKIQTDFPDFSQYDFVFVGFPVWWYTMATPGFSFLKEADFQGVKVVPFSTQGSNYGTFFEDFASNVRNAELQRSESFNNLPDKYNQAVDNKIAEWLNTL